MSNQPITKTVSNRICDHMNRDHKDALFKYVIYYAGIKNPNTVEMVAINSCLMTIEVDGEKINIPFNHKLLDSNDAHITLVQMIKDIPD